MGLARLVASAAVVVTGEGRLDAGTLSGKVVTEVLEAAGALPSLVVVGLAEPAATAALRARATGPVDVAELDVDLQGDQGTEAAIEAAVSGWLARRLARQPADSRHAR